MEFIFIRFELKLYFICTYTSHLNDVIHFKNQTLCEIFYFLEIIFRRLKFNLVKKKFNKIELNRLRKCLYIYIENEHSYVILSGILNTHQRLNMSYYFKLKKGP